MLNGLTKCVNGAITAMNVGLRTISGLLIVFITKLRAIRSMRTHHTEIGSRGGHIAFL